MKILNVMLGKNLGGIEQVFLDYNHALAIQNFNVIPVIHPKAKVKSKLNCPYTEVFNLSRYDLFAVSKLRKVLNLENPNCIITHGNRAFSLLKRANTELPIIPVCHNYNFKAFLGSTAIIAITNDIKNHLIKAGQKNDTIFVVPNMIHISEDTSYVPYTFHNPIRIGTIGRFVKKKGFDIFLYALHELKKRNINFIAYIAGDGEEQSNLKKMAGELNLKNNVIFLGWIDDKEKFYQSIDIFCLPSIHEPFGLVLLEAMKYSKTIVTTNSEGPSEIINSDSAVIVPINSYMAISNALEKLINNKELSTQLSKAAFEKVQDFSVLNISRGLKRVLERISYNRLSQ